MIKSEMIIRVEQRNQDHLRCRVEYHYDGHLVKFREATYRNSECKVLDGHLYDDLHTSARDALSHWLDELPLF